MIMRVDEVLLWLEVRSWSPGCKLIMSLDLPSANVRSESAAKQLEEEAAAAPPPLAAAAADFSRKLCTCQPNLMLFRSDKVVPVSNTTLAVDG